MYAVIKTGGHQYLVRQGDVLKVDKMAGEPGEAVVFNQILLAENNGELELDQAALARYRVEGVVKEQGREPKVLIMKYKRRKNHKKLRGHKQPITKVEITKIEKV